LFSQPFHGSRHRSHDTESARLAQAVSAALESLTRWR
jgi:hypothetical protein